MPLRCPLCERYFSPTRGRLQAIARWAEHVQRCAATMLEVAAPGVSPPSATGASATGDEPPSTSSMSDNGASVTSERNHTTDGGQSETDRSRKHDR